MCQMDMDSNNQNEQTTLLNILTYAVDGQGVCHLFETEMSNSSQSIPIQMDVSKSIAILSNQIDNSLDLIEKSSNYLSTQPFSILDFHENNLSSSINSNENISKTKKKKKKKLRYPSRRFMVLKKQFKAYLKKKKKKQQEQYQINNISNIIVHHQSQQIESSSIEHSTMIDFQLSPDLSKRKYIYKDITLANNNQNQINLRIFQCTQQPSSISSLDQTVTNDRSYHPFNCAINRISLPDIRIGLSRHHSTKQLHKTIID